MLQKFIERPVLSTVISVIIVILGFLGYSSLPIALYPQIAPPTVSVRTAYPGADAQTVLNSVVAPLKEAINGVEGMTYITSSASNGGGASIQVYFELGTDPDLAAINVQNRVAQVTNLLPQEVTRGGVIVQKQQTGQILIFMMYSDRFNGTFIENYARINVLPKIRRVEGVGDADAFGLNTYAMRIWLKPDVMASYGLVPADVIAALRSQSFSAAPGSFGENSNQAFQYDITYRGRLSTAPEYQNIIIRAGNNSSEILTLEDVARVELGATSYSSIGRAEGKNATGIFITKTAEANAQQVVQNVREVIDEAAKAFPEGMEYGVVYDANNFLTASINKVYETLLEAFILVFLVVFIFLQRWRATLIPAIAVPVSIIGTFFFLNLFGYSINLLTLFALVLAIGIVIDDAIIVVEAVQHKLEGGAESALEASKSAMSELTSAVITITLVMAAVFIPVTFIPGSTGVFFQQFGITLAVAIVISAVNALTLSPALCAVFLKPHSERHEDQNLLQRFHTAFDAAFESTKERYKKSLGFLTRHAWISGAVVALFILLFGFLLRTTPDGFVPSEDQGFLFANVSLPPASSLERTQEVLGQIDSVFKSIPAIETRFTLSGFGFLSGGGSQYGIAVADLKHWDEREMTAQEVVGVLQQKTADIKEAQILFFTPPVIPGFGGTGGFSFEIQDLQSGDLEGLDKIARQIQGQLMQKPGIMYASSFFETNYPQYQVFIDEAKALKAGVTPQQILDVMQGYYAGIYVSNFTRFGKLYRVYVKADASYRGSPESLQNVFVKTAMGAMAPINSFVRLERVYGPQSISRFNLYTSVGMNGGLAPGYSSGDAIAAIEQVFEESVPAGYGYAFSGLTREAAQSSGQAITIFALVLLFVYLLLSAQFESYLVSWSVILPLPIGLAGAYIFANIFGIANNIYVQIAVIMLMGLLAKNAILIVEFALQRRREEGMDIAKAAIEGAQVRLRPILMTSIAFIAGLLPLALATGVNANSNQSIGISAAGGMFVGTLVGIFVIPVLFILFQKLQEKISGPPKAVTGDANGKL